MTIILFIFSSKLFLHLEIMVILIDICFRDPNCPLNVNFTFSDAFKDKSRYKNLEWPSYDILMQKFLQIGRQNIFKKVTYRVIS